MSTALPGLDERREIGVALASALLPKSSSSEGEGQPLRSIIYILRHLY